MALATGRRHWKRLTRPAERRLNCRARWAAARAIRKRPWLSSWSMSPWSDLQQIRQKLQQQPPRLCHHRATKWRPLRPWQPRRSTSPGCAHTPTRRSCKNSSWSRTTRAKAPNCRLMCRLSYWACVTMWRTPIPSMGEFCSIFFLWPAAAPA